MLPFLEKKTGSASLPVDSIKRQPDSDSDAPQHKQIKEDLELAKALIEAALEALSKESK